MKHMVKLSVAGSLALASVGAHAGITVGTESSSSTAASTGDVVLFAEIYSGSSASPISAYVGDTGATVASVGAGTAPAPFEDPNLATFLSKYQAGYTLVWAVEGAGTTGNAGAPYVVSSSPTQAALGGTTGQALKPFYVGLINAVTNDINGTLGAATSLVGTDNSLISGNAFDPNKNSAANWFGASATPIYSTGLGTVATLYTLSASGIGPTNASTITPTLGVSLTANGLVYSAIGGGGGGGTPPVPLPAAVWLLGSGLLGLAGVGRRKSKAA